MGLAVWSSGGPALLPCPEEPGPLDCNLRAQLLPQFTLQAGWAEARGLWEGGGLWAGRPLWRWSGGGRAQLTGLPPLWGPGMPVAAHQAPMRFGVGALSEGVGHIFQPASQPLPRGCILSILKSGLAFDQLMHLLID